MIHTTRNLSDVPTGVPGGVVVIEVNPVYRFDLEDARRWFDQQRSDDLWFVTPYDWWAPESRQIAQVFDFFGFRGANIIHVTERHRTPHTAYLSARLEMYGDAILDEWAKPF